MPAAPVRRFCGLHAARQNVAARGEADSPIATFARTLPPADCVYANLKAAREQDVTTKNRTLANRTSFGQVPLLGGDKAHVDETTIADRPKCSTQNTASDRSCIADGSFAARSRRRCQVFPDFGDEQHFAGRRGDAPKLARDRWVCNIEWFSA
jgi:hypothetical protein